MRPIRGTFKAGQQDPWYANEKARRRQVREDARRPLAVNLAEGLGLSEFLSTFTGAARTASSQDQRGTRD
ncbi:MAG TPA: hypothetical protein VLC07_02680 [Solirubrobacterales bacterium]|nr:hypothetical protein [Solirubrobacterales bacterium]